MICLKVAFLQTFAEDAISTRQSDRHLDLPAKILKAVNFFCKSSILHIDWVANTPLECFVQNAEPKYTAIRKEKELLIAPFVGRFKTTTSGKL